MKSRICVLIGLLIGFLITQGVGIAQQTQSNVLFISVDDLRPALGTYGDSIAITPNIDRLAEEGVVFNRAYVQQAVCSPSRTSLLTGLRPDEVGVTDLKTHFREIHPNIVTLPQLFKNNGYQSVGIGKIFHYSPRHQDPISWSASAYETNHGLKETQYVLPENKTGGKAAATEKVNVRDEVYLDGKFTNLAIDFIRKFERSGDPFFLAVGYMKPHLPFAAPAKYWDMYEVDEFKNIEKSEKPLNAPDIAFHNNNELRGYNDIPDIGKGPIPDEKKIELRHGYYASVSYIDAQVGKILDSLDELGLRENTIIVFWGDHGFHLGEQSLWAKSTNFELDTRVPLIISAPGVNQNGIKSNAIVESLDVYPTLIDLCGITSKSKLSGTSLKPLLIDPTKSWKNIAYSQFPRPYSALGNIDRMTHMGYSVRTVEWRYTIWYNVETESFEFPELYSMKNFKIEDQNLAGSVKYEDIENQHHGLILKYLGIF